MAKFVKKIVKKRCPFCGEKAYIRRWNRYFYPDSFNFAVECNRCCIHSEVAKGARKAVENWEKELFSETQLSLTKDAHAEEVDSKNVLELIEKIITNEVAGFKSKYKLLLSLDKDSEDYIVHKKEFTKCEQDLIKTCDAWLSEEADEVVKKLKKQFQKEFKEEEKERRKKKDASNSSNSNNSINSKRGKRNGKSASAS